MHLKIPKAVSWVSLCWLIYIAASSAHSTDDVEGLTIQALRIDTGEAMWPVKWRLISNDETYDLSENSATLDLSQMLATELLAGDYTATAFAGKFAGSVNFTLPTEKTVIYVHLYRDVPTAPMDVTSPQKADKQP